MVTTEGQNEDQNTWNMVSKGEGNGIQVGLGASNGGARKNIAARAFVSHVT